MSEHPEHPESSGPDQVEPGGAGPDDATLDLGRAALLVAGPVVIAVFWAFGALPAWGAAALGGTMSVLAVVVLLRHRRVRDAGGRDAEGARVLVVGGGYAGLVAARALQARLPGGTRGGRHLGSGAVRGIAGITVVDPQSHMTYQPFLPEAAAGAIEPRHLTVPLRRALRRCDVVTGAVAAIDDAGRRAVVALPDGGVRELSYDVLVVAPGTVPRRLDVPGLEERARPFRSVTDALALRDHVLSRLDAASSTTDLAARRRLLTFTVIGGGFAGLEVLGELEDMTRRAARHQPGWVAEEIRWVLLEAADRIMPEVGPRLAARVHARLVARGVEVHAGARLRSAEGGRITLAGGLAFESDTVVVAAGSVPNPLLERTDLPLDERGRVRCATTLQVRDRPHVFTAGDCAAVPDVTAPPGPVPRSTAPTAQHAVRQARLLARNVDAHLAGRLLRGYRHRHAGCVAGLGRRRGAAEIGPLRLTGWPAWVIHRAYHLWAMPTADRTVRIALDWLVTGLLGRDLVAVGRRDTPAVPEPTPEPTPTASAPDPDPAIDGPTSVELRPVTPAGGWSALSFTPSGGFPAVPSSGPLRALSAPPVRPVPEDVPALQLAALQSGPLPTFVMPHPSGPLALEPHPSGPLAREPRPDHPRDPGPRAPFPSTTHPRHAQSSTR